ncbi:MAG: hypothetical protein LIP28_05175, partial [Deltaproteobacteria bacterium]|nr:hypothetical protein [Deltaproteobacteria bacterium]
VLRDATLTVDLPDGETSPVFLKEAGLDMDFTDKRQQVTLSADQLTVAKKLLLAKKTDLGIASEMGALAGYLPETIIAGGQVTMDVSVPGGNSLFLSFSPFALSVQDLGTCVVRAAIHGPADMKGDVSISLLEVELTDAGASDILFALIGKGQGKTPEFFRREIRMGLSTAGFTLSGPRAKLNPDVLDFLEKPGATLSVKFAPGRPVKPEEVEEMLLRDPESAGLSSTLTRPDASQGG